MDFRVLPEYIVEDIVDYLFFAVQFVPLIIRLDHLHSACLQSFSREIRIGRQSRAHDFCANLLAVYMVHQEPFLEIEDKRCAMASQFQSHAFDIWSLLGPFHEHLGIWSREEWYSWKYAEYSSYGASTCHASYDAFLHW